MSEFAIRVHKLGKRYRLGQREAAPASLREALTAWAGSPFQYLRQMSRPPTEAETIWALRDVTFDVRRGEVIGVIGHNGAGKSTLLKILSRITEPTEGRAVFKGRLGSLLEVGTGFHPELTGRENVYLNGAVLGMRRAEIDRKFDEIVAFADIERFLDTPVKRYSSGMYVRLAFSVAAHLDADILLMDEVLAVGDSAFRLKCFDKIQQLMEDGQTVVLVSHDMSAVSRLCRRAVLLHQGRLLEDNDVLKIVSRYLATIRTATAMQTWPDAATAPGNAVVRLRQARVLAEDQGTTDTLDIRRPVGIELIYDVLTPGQILIPNLHFHNDEGTHIFAVQDVSSEWRRRPRPTGRYTSIAWLPGNLLAEGRLTVDVHISSHRPETVIHAQARRVLTFQVVDRLEEGSARGDYTGPFPGVVRPMATWETEAPVKAELDRMPAD